MADLRDNFGQMLAQLLENSKRELSLVHELASGIRRVDDQMLREVRNVALQHEIRREAIFCELQKLASRLCALPSHNVLASVTSRDHVTGQAAIEGSVNGSPGGGSHGDWGKAAHKINDELSRLLDTQHQTH